MEMIEITLPWPPSVNTYWRNFDGRMIISARGREYRETVGDQMTLQKMVKHFKGQLKVEIEAFRPDKRRRDLDNLLKATLDGLAHAACTRMIHRLLTCTSTGQKILVEC